MKISELSLSKRIGAGFGIAVLLLLGISFWSARMLAEAGVQSSSVLVLACGAAACAITAGAWLVVTRSVRRQIGCEPAYAAWVANKIATGNLSLKIDLREGDRTSLLHEIVTMRDSLAGIVQQARQGADAVAKTSTTLAQGSLDISARTGQQVDSLNTMVAAMEEMTATIRQNAAHVTESSNLANSASGAAGKGGEMVARVVKTMETINESSRRIVDIIGVINGIAFQTNILALNAAVEAAHAGDQGRGFAVVATEVRALAERTAAAAREIKELINDSAAKISAGAELVGQAGATMTEIVDRVNQVTGVISHIKQATDQQSRGLQDINTSIGDLDQLAQQNARLVESVALAAESMQDQAGSLTQSVMIFKLEGSAKGGGPGVRAGAAAALPQVALTRQRSGFRARLIRFGYGLEEDSNQGHAARFFARDLAERSGGKLKVKEFGNSGLGNDEQMQEAMIAGSLEMMVGSTSTLVKYVPDFGVFDLPFLFADEHEADAALDGPLGQGMADKLEHVGLVGLVYWENGFRNLTNSKHPVARMEDLAGIRLRVMQNPIYVSMFENFGATAVPLPFAELFLALETKRVDGQENPLNTIWSSRFYEVQKYLSLTRHVYSPWIVTASKTWWDSLSGEERDAVEASAAASRQFERRYSRESASKALQFLKEHGMKVTAVEERELARMRERARQSIASSPHAAKWAELVSRRTSPALVR